MVTTQDYAFLSAAAYGAHPTNTLDLGEWYGSVSENASILGLGFKWGVYTRGTGPDREIVIAYAGTDGASPLDWITNIVTGTGLPVATQLYQAALVYALVRRQNQDVPAENFSFTGHSLGGGLASIMAVWTDRQATVFAPAPFENAVIGANGLVNLELAKYTLWQALGAEGPAFLTYGAKWCRCYAFSRTAELCESCSVAREATPGSPFGSPGREPFPWG